MKRRGGAVSFAFRDILYLMAFMYLLMFVIVLPALNPPAVEADAAKQPGTIIVSAAWPEGPTDVDLWLLAPGDKKAIGYSNRSGSVWNLLRDDLGTSGDSTPMNFESAFSRGSPAGEYVINTHCFKCPSAPVPVTVEVRIAQPGQPSLPLRVDTVILAAQGSEVTAIRFKLDSNGRIVPGSVNRVFKPLRVAK